MFAGDWVVSIGVCLSIFKQQQQQSHRAVMTLPPDTRECQGASAAAGSCIAVLQAAAASETLADPGTGAATAGAASTTAARGMRRLAQEAEAGAAASASSLSPACDALVRLAEPGDVYAHYNRAMSAAAVSTQIKAIEQRLGLKVGCPLLYDQVATCDTEICTVLSGRQSIPATVTLYLYRIHLNRTVFSSPC